MGHHSTSSWAMASHLVRANIKYFLAVWLLLFFGVAAAAGIVALFTDPTVSILDFTTTPPRYWMLVVGILFPGLIARVYIAHGVTRTNLARGAVIATVVISVALGLLMAVAFGIEHLVFQANGWSAVIEGHLFSTSDRFGLVFIEFTAVYITHFLAGWGIGLLYLRFKKSLATVLLIPAFVPAAMTEWMLRTGWLGNAWNGAVGGEFLAPLPAMVITVGIIALQIGVNYAVMRTMPVAAKSD